MDITDPKQDARIRAALRKADERGRLGVVAAVTGISGGVAALRRIMRSTDALPIMDRSLLAVHLKD